MASNNLCWCICCVPVPGLLTQPGRYLSVEVRHRDNYPTNFGEHARKQGLEAHDHLEIIEQLKSFFHQVTYVAYVLQKPSPKMGHRGSLGRDKRHTVFYSKLILLTPPQKRFMSVSHESQMAPQQMQNFNTAATTCGQKRFTGEADPHQL